MSDPSSIPDYNTLQTHPQQQQHPNPNLIPPPLPPPVAGPPPISFRPLPHFAPLPSYPNAAAPGVQPPGVSSAAVPMMVPPILRAYGPTPSGFSAVGGLAAPPGIPRYPVLPIVRPLFPPHPPGVPVVLPVGSRPLVPGAPIVRPVIVPLVRPVIPSVTPAEKPQTTVYVGKIASTVEDDFIHSVLQVFGPVKNWKRAQNPDGSLRGFGFCEYESAEGLLRALRLFSKFDIDGQEIMLNITGATKEYLELYVQKKSENSKNEKKDEGTGSENDEAVAKGGEKNDPSKSSAKDSSNENDKEKKIHNLAYSGIVTDEDREADREALEKLTSMLEERLKNKPPPPLPVDGFENLNSDVPAKIRDGESDAGIGEDKNDDETTSDNKAASELDKVDTSSPDHNRRYDRRSRDSDRNMKREKDREIERYERETERERIRREREQRRKMEEAEREYEERLNNWEYREREKEKQRQYEKEKEKERERKRWKEILYEEEDDDDGDDSRKRWRRSALEERRIKRLREKEEDLADRIKEEEEEEEEQIAEAKRRSEEEKLQKEQNDSLNHSSSPTVNGIEKMELSEEYNGENKEKAVEQDDIGSVDKNLSGGVLQNPNGDDSTVSKRDARQNGTASSTRKLGFGLVGSGKRAVVLSVFNEEDEDDAHKDKRMRPLVPIDYSTEEMQAVEPTVSGAQPNLVAAAEFARRISNVPGKDEKPDTERERSRRSSDRFSHRERDRDHNDENINRTKDDNKKKIIGRERNREHGSDKVKTPDKQKLLDAKQLIDMIPKTKDELFSYEINWAVYDKHELHERMRPWISKKITEFLGEEETTLVDYIVSSTQEHVQASKMLDLLQAILDEEAEMFVLKMWRMLIFEIKKVETGLAIRSKT